MDGFLDLMNADRMTIALGSAPLILLGLTRFALIYRASMGRDRDKPSALPARNPTQAFPTRERKP